VKAFFVTAIRFIAVAVLYFGCFAVVSGALLSGAAEQPSPAEAANALLALLAVSFINAAVWTYLILRSRWTSWKLILTIMLLFFGVGTLMPQIETAYFITRLPPGMLPRLFLAGVIMAEVFAPQAVLILARARAGKAKPVADETSGDSGLKRSVGEWTVGERVVKLSLIVAAYLLIYFTFGYFIAWKNPAVRAYYGGNDPSSFLAHIASLLRTEPGLFLLQVVRALLWTAFAVPVIKMMRGAWWESGLAVALLFAVMTSQLLLPNPLMPPEVRMVHLVETATSNFLFGWLVVLIWCGTNTPHRQRRELPT
jgi:hypothetical protein